MSKGLQSMQAKEFPWLKSHPSFVAPREVDGVLHRVPVLSDDLAQNLGNGSVESVFGIKEVTGPKSVLLTDGRVLEDIDTIMVCSGYHYDFSLVKGAGDPTDEAFAPDHYEKIRKSQYYDDENNKFPRLYQGFISEQYPESLAFLGHMLIAKSPFVLYDLVTMALASVWSGGYPLASSDEMRRDIDSHYDFMTGTLKNGAVPHLGFRLNWGSTYEWLNQAAGTGVTDRCGSWSWQGWKFWWSDRKFYGLLMDGTQVPAVYRLFDTGRGRKRWDGAREHIEKMNEAVKELGEEWEREERSKKTK